MVFAIIRKNSRFSYYACEYIRTCPYHFFGFSNYAFKRPRMVSCCILFVRKHFSYVACRCLYGLRTFPPCALDVNSPVLLVFHRISARLLRKFNFPERTGSFCWPRRDLVAMDNANNTATIRRLHLYDHGYIYEAKNGLYVVHWDLALSKIFFSVLCFDKVHCSPILIPDFAHHRPSGMRPLFASAPKSLVKLLESTNLCRCLFFFSYITEDFRPLAPSK